MTKAIIVLGPDRVGKSTLIESTKKSLVKGGYEVSCLHFREVQPHHHSPIDQYYDAFGGNFNRENGYSDYFLIDRFVPDTLFYETHRANFPSIDPSLARTVESMLIDGCGGIENIQVMHVCTPWSSEISDRHRTEILEKYPNCTEYWVRINLEKAEAEHQNYNSFIQEYFTNGDSLIPKHKYLCCYQLILSKVSTVFDVESLTGMRISL